MVEHAEEDARPRQRRVLLGIRIKSEANDALVEEANKAGISKSALVRWLIAIGLRPSDASACSSLRMAVTARP